MPISATVRTTMLSTYEPGAQRNVQALQEQSPSNEFSLASWTAIHNMKNITIRPLNENDACDFHTLRLRALKEHPDAFSSTYERESAYSMEFVAERLRRTAESRNNFTLGALRQKELIGVVGFRRIDGVKEQHRGHIWGMYVRSEEQGKGIGRALLSKAIDLANSLPGLEQIELDVVTRNRQARNLYASLGFASCGIDPRALFVDGEYLDEERMVLFLSGC